MRSHAALALRQMHQLGVLPHIIPEFKAIDCLVLRDLYHRYTVDEHSILAVESLHKLDNPGSEAEQHFAEIQKELLYPERLLIATLLHDIGKAFDAEDHVGSGTRIARQRMKTLGLQEEEIEDACFLIQYHLDMSAAMRRDIFDPASVEAFARKAATPERLKMLCLLTWADIKAVNPDALTPWKEENLWQLYIGASRALGRLLDQERLQANEDDEQLSNIRMLAPRLGRRLKEFLEGLPQRYLKVHSAEEILAHIEMASHLGGKPVQSRLNRKGETFELAVVTTDRPMLFANISGTLAAWGMNIVRADVFTNARGVAVDTFLFTDRFHTLELNLQEWERFQASIVDVLTGATSLEKLAAGRRRVNRTQPHIEIPTNISYDDASSEHCTLLEVITQDRQGLLYRIGAQLAECRCNIELALIDTKGQTAIDVFYLTAAGGKLDEKQKQQLAKGLAAELATRR
jgi:[protein-PII] uridylyltransferase